MISLVSLNSCNVNGRIIKVDEVITAKINKKFAKVKITAFKVVDHSSIWMKVVNIAEVKEVDWLSVKNWSEDQPQPISSPQPQPKPQPQNLSKNIDLNDFI